MHRLLAAAFFLLSAVLLTGWWATGAVGHSWYPPECCSDHDCAPMPAATIPKPMDGGDWLLTTGELVPRSKVKWSPDGHYHLCRMGETIFCLFVPPQGS